MIKYTKNRWFRYICFLQIFLLLVSTIGLSIDVHYCQGKVKSIGFFANAEECGLEKTIQHGEDSQEERLSKKPCCENSNYYFHSDELAVNKAVATNLNKLVVAFSYQVNASFEYPKFNKKTSVLSGKAPPLRVNDLNILYSTFII